MLDVQSVREDFPMIQNHPELVYFDSAATSLKPQCVVDAVTDFYTKHTSNVHRGDYSVAVENDRLYDEARASFAKLIHADKDEIVFTHNVSYALNQVAYGLSKKLKAGDVILTTKAEHASNLLPWFRMQKEIGIRIEYVELDEQARCTVEAFEKAMHEGVKVVCMAETTNVLGSIQPMKEITQIAHRYGALVVVDGAQSVPHHAVDVKDADYDFLGFSAHKMCGPGGVGILYGKKALLEELEPMCLGGDMNARFSSDGEMILKDVPIRFEAGTPNIEGILGAAAAAEYLMNLGMDSIEAYEKELRAYFAERMRELDNITFYNPDNAYGPIVFNAKDVFSQDATGYLASKNIAVRSGNHCAKILHEIIGTDSTVRASLYFYNTKQEVDTFVKACKEINLENAVGIFF